MKDPAVLFYTADFIAGTLTMTDEQRGRYILLLCLQHQQGGLSEEDMLNICKTYDAKVFSKFHRAEDGFYYNERMRTEADKRKKYSESRRNNRVTKEKDKKDTDNICKTYDKHMGNENININVIKNKGGMGEKELNIPFDVFWDSYGRKEGDKNACKKKWHKLSDADRQKIIDTLPAFLAKIKDRQFQPYPATYLNQQRWNDEIEVHAEPEYFMP